MFLKVLLLLPYAVFSQGFRTEEEECCDQAGSEIPGGLEVGKALKFSTSYPSLVEVFIRTEAVKNGNGDVGLYFTYNHIYGIVCTSLNVNGSQHNENTYSSEPQKKITLIVVVEEDYFDITFNGRQYFVNHVVPVESLKYWDLYSSAKNIDEARWFRQFVPCTCICQSV